MQGHLQFSFGPEESFLLPTAITRVLTSLERDADHRVRAEQLEKFGRVLLDAPEDASDLLDEIAGMTTASAREEQMSHLLGAALDQARMARENGQKRGAAFIETLEDQVGQLVATGSLSFRGSLAVSSTWVRAGLTPPESLGSGHDCVADALPCADRDETEDIEALFERLFDDVTDASGGSLSAMHATFAEMLPTVPADARYALVRIAVARPAELFAELGCAWLLDPSEHVRSGAAIGLADRLRAGRLSAEVLGRLSIMRSWLTDDSLKDQLDGLLREAMRKGIAGPERRAEPRIHRIVASMVDGSGAQSMAAAVQSGSSRSVAVVLLKQGFGVKDAYVVPCTSATEQRTILATMTDEIEAIDVPRDYIAQAITLALAEGLEMNVAPVPGLVDVVQNCDLTEVRPGQAAVGGVLDLADPDGRISSLSAQARGRLITASEHWEERYPMLASWFEDSDETVEALEKATSRAALMRGMWKVLETRRQHWAKVIARNALLLKAAGKDGADEFIAVAAALAEGRDLKKTPVMQFIHDLSIEVWVNRRSDPDGLFGGPDPDLPFGTALPPTTADMPMPDSRPEKKGELARLLDPAGLTETWIEGYLTSVCTAPIFIPPSDWLGPLFHLAAPSLETEKKLERFIELLMLRYNAAVSKFHAPDEVPLIPGDVPLMSIWADGYLTAWESNKSCWPARKLGREGKSIRKLLEDGADGRIDQSEFASALPVWLRQRFADQKL